MKTIVYHGSPLSKWDNRDIWSKFDYRDYGINGEVIFDIDFKKTFYLTDTGRTWSGKAFSIRDKVEQNFQMSYSNSFQIIEAINKIETTR